MLSEYEVCANSTRSSENLEFSPNFGMCVTVVSIFQRQNSKLLEICVILERKNISRNKNIRYMWVVFYINGLRPIYLILIFSHFLFVVTDIL